MFLTILLALIGLFSSFVFLPRTTKDTTNEPAECQNRPSAHWSFVTIVCDDDDDTAAGCPFKFSCLEELVGVFTAHVARLTSL